MINVNVTIEIILNQSTINHTLDLSFINPNIIVNS